MKIEPADVGFTSGNNTVTGEPSTGRTKYTVKDILTYIPTPLQYKWIDEFIPELISRIGVQGCPWNLNGINLSSLIKTVWRCVFPGLRTPPAEPKTALYLVVSNINASVQLSLPKTACL